MFQNASSGETGVAVVGPSNKLDYYWNTFGQGSWNWVSIAGSNTGIAAPAVIQRSGGEVDVVSVGQNNTLDFYYSANGHGAWNPLPQHTKESFTIGVMGLGVSQGHRITIRAAGDDADAAVEALVALVEAGIGEGNDAP